MPWEQTDEFIRSGHRELNDFEPNSFRTVWISRKEGVKAVVGKFKGNGKSVEVVSYLFSKDRGWTLEKAKKWFNDHEQGGKNTNATIEHLCYIAPIMEKIMEKPLRIRGVALTAGISRNLNIYVDSELEEFAKRLVGAPVYVEHVSAFDAVGKVTQSGWNKDSKTVFYEAEIHDEETAEKIRKGMIQHVSVAADYERLDVVNGKIPRGLHNAELSLVAVPGIPQTNIQIVESLTVKKDAFTTQLERELDELKRNMATLDSRINVIEELGKQRLAETKREAARAVIAPEALEQANHTVDFSTIRLRDVMEKRT